MGRIIIYSANPTARAALAELFPEAEVTGRSSEAVRLATGAAVLVADLAVEEAGDWLDEVLTGKIILSADKRSAGGADVLPKPCRFTDLARRVARQVAAVAGTFPVGPFVCDPAERVLLTAEGEEETRLTEKEAQLLTLLAQKRRVSRNELLEAVWGYREGLETHTLETHIYRLRQKLGDDAANPRILLTVENGYALAGE